jgi:drug/metabolite transporter (DMT)-like permease
MYSMPVWRGILAHFFLPGERTTLLKATGRTLAFLGTALVILGLFSVCPTSTVASFLFLTPILSIILGHFIFGELLSPSLIAATALVPCGVVWINRNV